MERDTIQKIEDLVRKGAPVIQLPGDRRGRHFLLQADGDYEEVEIEIDPFGVACLDVDTLVRLTNVAAADQDTTDLGVYVSEAEVVSVYSNDTAYWRDTLKLPLHPTFALLEQHVAGKAYGQKDLVRLLRTQFPGHIEPSLVETLRTLRFNTQGGGTSSTRVGSEGLSRDIVRHVERENGQAIPDELHFKVPVYDLPETRGTLYDVTLLVETDVTDTDVRFMLYARQADLRAAREDALGAVMEALRAGLSDDVDVYRGSPAAK